MRPSCRWLAWRECSDRKIVLDSVTAASLSLPPFSILPSPPPLALSRSVFLSLCSARAISVTCLGPVHRLIHLHHKQAFEAKLNAQKAELLTQRKQPSAGAVARPQHREGRASASAVAVARRPATVSVFLFLSVYLCPPLFCLSVCLSPFLSPLTPSLCLSSPHPLRIARASHSRRGSITHPHGTQ